MATHIRLQYKPAKGSRNWRDSSLTMWSAGLANMEATAKSLAAQNGWHAWQIVPYQP